MIKNQIWRELVVNDIHLPRENTKALNCVFKVMQDIPFDGITLNGDIGDWESVSRHSRFSPPKCHWTDSQFLEASEHEYDALTKFLDKIDKVAPQARKRFEKGNHEVWVDDFIKESYYSRFKQFDLDQRLRLKERGYTIFNYNTFMKLGKLNVTHGIYTGANHSKKHVESMGASILYGHVHDIQVFSKITPDKQSHMAWSNGCLCDLNPDYMRNRPQNWNHGFAIVYVWPNNSFQVDIIRINSGKCVVEGKLYSGN